MYDCQLSCSLAYIDYWRISVRRNTLKIGWKHVKNSLNEFKFCKQSEICFFLCTEIVLFLHLEVLKIFLADIANMFFHFRSFLSNIFHADSFFTKIDTFWIFKCHQSNYHTSMYHNFTIVVDRTKSHNIYLS